MRIFAALLLAAAVATGCARTQPSRFYALDRDPTIPLPSLGADAASRPLVCIGSVTVPSHLLRPQLAERSGTAEIRYLSFDRWASMLDEEIQAALELNLVGLLSDKATFVRDLSTPDRDVTVHIRIVRFERDGRESVRLEAYWKILREPSDSIVAYNGCDLTRPVESPGVEGSVEALNAALGEMSRQLARDLAAAIDLGP